MISVDEFQEKLADLSVDDEEIAQYLEGVADESAALGPVLRPDPTKVRVTSDMDAMRVQAAFASNALSRVDRWRRQQRFLAGVARAGNRPPILYAEGDSWFQFPFMLRDLVNQLSLSHLVWCTSAPGDTLENMVHENPEYLKALRFLIHERGLPVRYFLLSGAGNDVVGLRDGVSAMDRIVRPFDAGKSAEWHIETDGLDTALHEIRRAYIQVLDDVDREFPPDDYPDLKVVIHGYDYSPTRSVPGPDRNRPAWARDWSGEPLRKKGFRDKARADAVVRALIDRLNEMTGRLCAAFAHRAIHADLRGSVPADGWIDELHPTSDGFQSAAAKMRTYLR